MNYWDILSRYQGKKAKDTKPKVAILAVPSQYPGQVGFTGFGPGGSFDKNRPKGIVQGGQGPVAVHEGEGMIQNKDGSTTVVSQKQLQQIAKHLDIPGMANSGTIPPRHDARTGEAVAGTGSLPVGNSSMPPRHDATTGQTVAGTGAPAVTRTAQGQVNYGPSSLGLSIPGAQQTRTAQGQVHYAPSLLGLSIPGIQQTRTDIGNVSPNPGSPSTTIDLSKVNLTDTSKPQEQPKTTSQNILDYALRTYDTSLAANKQATQQILATRPGMTEGAQNAAIADIARSGESGRAQLAADVTNQQMQLQQQQGVQAMGLIGTRVGTLLTGGQTLDQIQNDPTAIAEVKSYMPNATPEQIKQEITTQYNVAKRGIQTQSAAAEANSPASARIGMLSSGGQSLAQIQADPTVVADVKAYMPNATPEQIKDEIAARYKATQSTNLGTYASNQTTLLKGAIQRNATLADVTTISAINAPLRSATANKLGLDPNSTDPTVQAQITADIKNEYTQLTQSPTTTAYNSYLNNFGDVPIMAGGQTLNQLIQSDPVAGGELKNSIGTMLMNGDLSLDASGNVTVKSGTLGLPWENPGSYFQFTDWNGKAVTQHNPDGSAVMSGNVNVDGKEYVNKTTKAPVAQADATVAWDRAYNANPIGMQRYFKDANGQVTSSPNIKAFLDDTYNTVESADAQGNITPVEVTPTSVIQRQNNVITSNGIDAVVNGFQSGATIPGTVSSVNPSGGGTLQSGQFIYYDKKGSPTVGSTTSSSFRNIVQQFSMVFNGGNPLTAQQFSTLWNDGVGWVVGDGGMIQNFQSTWQTEHGLTPTSGDSTGISYRIGGESSSALATATFNKTDPTLAGYAGIILGRGFENARQGTSEDEATIPGSLGMNIRDTKDNITTPMSAADLHSAIGSSFTQDGQTYKIVDMYTASTDAGMLVCAQLDSNGGITGYTQIRIKYNHK
jgi:hypothetical protein